MGSGVKEFLCLGDSEIVLSWIIYEKVKLTTFVRNRVANIREKMGLDALYHVEGISNLRTWGRALTRSLRTV